MGKKSSSLGLLRCPTDWQAFATKLATLNTAPLAADIMIKIGAMSRCSNWYWARASVGPYTIIASHITAARAYGYVTQIVYMLARDGRIIADDDAKVAFETDLVAIDRKTGKPVADVTRYTYRDAATRYVVSFEREKTIHQAILTDRAPLLKRIIAGLIGFDGAYHRFAGKATIEKFEGDARVERFDGHAIWELMYFGRSRLEGAPFQGSLP